MTSRHDENMRNPEYRAVFAEYCAGFEDPGDCTCSDTFNPKCPEHGGNEHRP